MKITLVKISLAVFFLVLADLHAQSRKITVISEAGRPIVNAVVKSEKHAAVTDDKGEFELSVFNGDTLITVSHVSFETRKFSVSELRSLRKITMKRKTYKTEEVKINGEQESDVSDINIKIEERGVYNQVADLLKTRSPLFIKDYGGYSGLKTISFRGMSSENTLVLFNEARVNDLRSGAFDFAGVGINAVDKMTFYETEFNGEISSGGALNLTAGTLPNKNNLNLGISYSSLNSQSFFGNGGYKNGALSAVFNFERSFSPNEFPFKFEGESLRRANADYQKTFFGGALIYTTEKYYAKVYSHYSYFQNGLPGFVVTNNVNSSLAETFSKTFLTTANFVAELSKRTEYKAVASFTEQTIGITDTTNELLINRDYEQADLSNVNFANSLDWKSEAFNISVGANFSYGKLNSLSPSFLGDEKYSSERFTQNYYLSPQIPLGDFSFVRNLILGGTISYEILNETIIAANDINGYFSSLAYLKFNLFSENLKIKISHSNSYRIPTFTEQYYSQVFSPDKIDAEKYRNLSFTVLYEKDFYAFKATYFSINGDNKIVWTPTRLALQIPRNIKKIKSSGAEFSAEVKPFENLSASLVYVYTDARNVSAQSQDDATYNKQLIYTPRNQLKAVLQYNSKVFFAMLAYTFTDKRYYTADNNPRFVLPSYDLFDLSLGYKFDIYGLKNRLTLNIYNLTDENYFVIQSYPMPLRTASINFITEIL